MIKTKSQIRPRFEKFVLTNAEILSLPTANTGAFGGLLLVPPPSPSVFLIPLWASVGFDNHGNVTGIDDPSSIQIMDENFSVFLSPLLENSVAVPAQATISGLLASGQNQLAYMSLLQSEASLSVVGPSGFPGTVAVVESAAPDIFELNRGLVLFSTNAANYTGGNAANTLTIYLSYQIVNFP